MRDPDAIVIGAGQNGLTCACYLARAEFKVLVLVLEAYEQTGGMTFTQEATVPGFWPRRRAGHDLTRGDAAL